MDATHFRQRAARAREMAESGEDIRLSKMLLDVAHDLDAEAKAIESGGTMERRRHTRLRPVGIHEALLHANDDYWDMTPVQIINLSRSGAKLRTERPQMVGSKVTLELPDEGLHLDGSILRVSGSEAAIAFDPVASADSGLNRLLQEQQAKKAGGAVGREGWGAALGQEPGCPFDSDIRRIDQTE